jgi:formylglycine-generating enzyme required for sulfatase activity
VTSQLKNELGMEFVRIPPGEFMMGCSEGDVLCDADETPRHRVQLTKGFEIGKFEVTQAQWMALMHDNPSSQQGSDLPVETISKLDAQQFLAKLNDLHDGYRYRLPTEAEWEYAARAGQNPAATGKLDEIAWYAANSDEETHPVGMKKPNAWGIFDMLGNVREWVSDLYSATYYSQSPASDPSGPSPEQYAASGPGRGGRGGPGGRGPVGRGPTLAPVPPVQLPPGATPQQQIDALRQEVAQLRDEVRQLRDQLGGSPPFGNPGPGRGAPPPGGANQFGFGGPGRGGPQALGNPPAGPAVLGDGGQLIDPLDGLPTGLPVVRGGGWDQSAKFQRVSARYTYYGPTLRVSDIGLRVVRMQ